jgi:hypothetical protein
VEDVLTTEVDAIDLAAVYGLKLPGLEHEVPSAAITLRPGEELDPASLRRAVRRRLKDIDRPVLVRLVSDLPLTAGHRVRKRSLRQDGLDLDGNQNFDVPGSGSQTFWLAPGEEDYAPLTSENLSQLIDHLSHIESSFSDR